MKYFWREKVLKSSYFWWSEFICANKKFYISEGGFCGAIGKKRGFQLLRIYYSINEKEINFLNQNAETINGFCTSLIYM